MKQTSVGLENEIFKLLQKLNAHSVVHTARQPQTRQPADFPKDPSPNVWFFDLGFRSAGHGCNVNEPGP